MVPNISTTSSSLTAANAEPKNTASNVREIKQGPASSHEARRVLGVSLLLYSGISYQKTGREDEPAAQDHLQDRKPEAHVEIVVTNVRDNDQFDPDDEE